MIASVAGAKAPQGADSDKDKKRHGDPAKAVAEEDAPRRAEDESLPALSSAPVPRVAASIRGGSNGQATAATAAPTAGDDQAGARVTADDDRYPVRQLFVDDEEDAGGYLRACRATTSRSSRSSIRRGPAPVLGS